MASIRPAVRGAGRFTAGMLATALLALAPLGPRPALAQEPAPARAIRVPQDVGTIQEAMELARPGDLILLDRGSYPGGVVVPEDRPGITIRGVDRNAVVFDGEGVREDAIEVHADDVTLENLTADHFAGDAFSWVGVDGFTGRYLTVWNVEYYGLFAIASRGGLIEESYVSGAADAAFYIGECRPCDSVITGVVARLSSIGYSGTNASGNLTVRDGSRTARASCRTPTTRSASPRRETPSSPGTSSPTAERCPPRTRAPSAASRGSASPWRAGRATSSRGTRSPGAIATASSCSRRSSGRGRPGDRKAT